MQEKTFRRVDVGVTLKVSPEGNVRPLTITSWQCLHVTLIVPDSSFKPVTILPQFGQCHENGTHS